MQNLSRVLLVMSIAMYVFACNNTSEKKNDTKDQVVNSVVADTPPPSPPKIEMQPAPKKCFVNDGLKTKTTITIFFGDNVVLGTIVSEDYGAAKREKTSFEGTLSGNNLIITFKDAPPAIDTVSEWTNKLWVIEKKKGQESLNIIFNVKSPGTNKWADHIYKFLSVDCK